MRSYVIVFLCPLYTEYDDYYYTDWRYALKDKKIWGDGKKISFFFISWEILFYLLHLLNIDDVVVDDENEVKNIADIFMSHTCEMYGNVMRHANFYWNLLEFVFFFFAVFCDFLRDWICMANLLYLFVMPY